MMRTPSTICRYLLVAALLGMGLIAHAVTLAFPPAVWHKGRPDETARVQTVLSLYLRDAFTGAPDVRVAEEAWVGAVLTEVRGYKRIADPTTFFAAFTSYLPVDAFLDLTLEEGKSCTFTLYTRAGRRTLTVPLQMTAKRPQVCRQLAQALGPFLAKELALPPATAARLRLPDGDDALFEAVQLARRLQGDWVVSNAEAQFKALLPFQERLKDSALLRRASLEAGLQLTTDKRKADNPDLQLLKARVALVHTLGTPDEPKALDFLRRTAHGKAALEGDLLAFVKALEEGEMLEADEDQGADEPAMDTSLMGLLKPPGTLAQCLGALRGLGVLQAKGALPALGRLGKHPEAGVRRAVARALGAYGDLPAARMPLQALANDADQAVAFEALAGRWRDGTATDVTPDERRRLLTLARDVLAREPGNRTTVHVLATLGGAPEIAVLQAALAHTDPAVRADAAEGLFRLQAVDPARLAALLADPAAEVVEGALQHLALANPETLPRLLAFANNPYEPIADTASHRAEGALPATEPARTRFLLDTADRYTRRRLVETLATGQAPWALEALLHAAGNAQPHVRAEALVALAGRAPERAAPLVKAALTDPYRWVRFRAATLAPALANLIGPEAVRAAQAIETDPAARLYLADALALAEGKALPAPPPSANRLDPRQTYAGLCGHGPQAPESPFELYYNLNAKIDEAAKAASAKGKVFLCRVDTAHNPCQVRLDPNWDDLAWQAVRDGLADWRWIDGVVIGEETMYARPNDPNVWRYGWRAFCREAGIDPARIDGERSKLSPAEGRAWEVWEQRVAIAGFNDLYDFVKLYFGKLRPGFLVGTFMPDQDSLKPGEATWKFDVGGAYYYETNNRERHAMVRRYRTVWPDRPVLWLSMGEGAIKGAVRYNLKVPEAPVLRRDGLAYADSVCAWLAGADPGFFQAYLFMDRKCPGGFEAYGKWVFIESIGKEEPELDTGVANAFSGIAEWYLSESKEAPGGPGDEEEPALVDDDRAEKKAQVTARVAKEKTRMRLGFFLEQQYQYNVARVLADLPKPASRPTTLWVSAGRRATPLEWANDYDLQYQLNELATMELTRYKTIGVLGQEKTPLRDATMAAVTQWLKAAPGLLYIRGALASDNAHEASTPDDHDGMLTLDWPWEKDVVIQGTSYQTSGAARALQGTPEAATLVYWKGEGMRGGVLFDLTPEAGARERVNALILREKVGAPLEGTPGYKIARLGGLTAVAATGGEAEPFPLQGVDLLTGEPNPTLTRGRSAALVADDYQGRFVFAKGGIALLGSQPLAGVSATADGVTVSCPGLLQIGTVTGKATVQTAGGRALKPVPATELIEWLLFGTTEGVATVPVGDKGAVVTYVRCTEAVRVGRN
jgi:hypothetical protein